MTSLLRVLGDSSVKISFVHYLTVVTGAILLYIISVSMRCDPVGSFLSSYGNAHVALCP